MTVFLLQQVLQCAKTAKQWNNIALQLSTRSHKPVQPETNHVFEQMETVKRQSGSKKICVLYFWEGTGALLLYLDTVF